MSEDDLRTTITTALVCERQDSLEEKLEELRKRHAEEIETAVDKALAAIRGKGKAKVKAPRKPRKDKGTPRLGRGMPKIPPKPPEPENVRFKSSQEPHEKAYPAREREGSL